MDKKLQLMRALTATQAALWDLIDEPKSKNGVAMLEMMLLSVARLTAEVLKEEGQTKQ